MSRSRLSWVVAIAVLTGALAGCSGGAQPIAQQPPATPPTDLPANLDLTYVSRLSLVRPAGRLRVGETKEAALFLYPPPEKAEMFGNLPFNLGDDYTASGWEKEDEGFGVILLKNRVVLAQRSLIGIDEERLKEVLATYEQDAGRKADRQVQLDAVRYWFWTDGVHRLMICAVKPKTDRMTVAVSLGHVLAMDRFGMNPAKAQEDAEAALKILENAGTKKS